jgi:hypothetical protein
MRDSSWSANKNGGLLGMACKPYSHTDSLGKRAIIALVSPWLPEGTLFAVTPNGTMSLLSVVRGQS